MQLFGKSAMIAIGSVMVVCTKPRGETVTAHEIAEELGLSPYYVIKILGQLVREGVLGSKRGASGGYYLKRCPSDLTVWDILRPFESVTRGLSCSTTQCPTCAERIACVVPRCWSLLVADILMAMRERTVAQLYQRLEAPVTETPSFAGGEAVH